MFGFGKKEKLAKGQFRLVKKTYQSGRVAYDVERTRPDYDGDYQWLVHQSFDDYKEACEWILKERERIADQTVVSYEEVKLICGGCKCENISLTSCVGYAII